MFQLSEGDKICNGVKLHYYRTGGNLPPMVLAHGFSDDGPCWTPVARALASRYDLTLVDFRGHGKSEAPEQGYNMVTMASELASLITGLELKSPVVLGHSMGAVIALTLAGLYPDLPKAILLEDPPPFWQPATGNGGGRDGSFHAFIEGVKRKTQAELLAEVRAGNPTWSEEETSLWADSKQRLSTRILSLVSIGDVTPPAFPSLLQRITCPALLMRADPAHGVNLTDADVSALQAGVPHLKVVMIPDAGHSIRREQFAHYMDVVQTFLSGL
jgi:N-formylmaleamate deformylase